MPPKKKSAPEDLSVPAPSKKQDGSTGYLIALGVMLVLFAGTVVILLASPQGKKLLGRAPSANSNANAPAAGGNANANTNTPAEEPAEEPGLPVGGQVELVNAMDADNVVIVDQKVIWRSESGDLTLVEHASDLLPALKAGDSALVIVARPSGSTRTIFAFGCAGGCDAPGATQPIAFDPALRAFIPLINPPDHYIAGSLLSPNQRRMWYTGPSGEEQRELWVYDFVNDKQTVAVRLPAGESLTECVPEIGPPESVRIRWTDPTMLEYKVYRGSGTVPFCERPRTEIATRTVSVPQ
ncbi:hypothetical protein EPO33_05430 [Patescibacteria group bacterium]|nr:MAG: hypothetical protein EPO33_05430 [Patescibacteria group bacterium]